MGPALESFLAKLEEDGKPTKVETDKKGVSFFAVEVNTLRKYMSDIFGLVQYKCIGYVSIRKRGTKEVARLYPSTTN
jgi:hypothetical protein